MSIVFMGTPEFGAIVLERIVGKLNITAVYTKPDKPIGRGLKLLPSPVKQVALKYNLPLFQPLSLRKAEEQEKLKGLSPEIIVVAAYGLLLPKEVLDIPPHGCLNIHPSLLPKYRGAAPIQGALLNGEEVTGVSIMLLDEGMDTGPILAQEELNILPEDDAGILTKKLAEKGAEFLLNIYPLWLKGEIKPQPQDHSLATYTYPIEKEEGKLDFNQPAIKLWHKIRAFNPSPAAYTFWQGRRLKIIKAFPLPGETSQLPGKVKMLGQRCIVETGEGVLELREVQLEGKRALTIEEFLRGARGFIGSLLTA